MTIAARNLSSVNCKLTLAWIELAVGLDGKPQRMHRVLDLDTPLRAICLNDVRLGACNFATSHNGGVRIKFDAQSI